mmetsp:Transcript_65382/g.164791  ORF Transcript_65382/g.164791 Transcript_65382/m.164791 type:complete len:233 (+) Transcript_65382:131-829(+)
MLRAQVSNSTGVWQAARLSSVRNQQVFGSGPAGTVTASQRGSAWHSALHAASERLVGMGSLPAIASAPCPGRQFVVECWTQAPPTGGSGAGAKVGEGTPTEGGSGEGVGTDSGGVSAWMHSQIKSEVPGKIELQVSVSLTSQSSSTSSHAPLHMRPWDSQYSQHGRLVMLPARTLHPSEEHVRLTSGKSRQRGKIMIGSRGGLGVGEELGEDVVTPRGCSPPHINVLPRMML